MELGTADQELLLDKDRLYVTIFEGDHKEGLAKDEEAFVEWKKYIAEDRILLGNKKDNFWEMAIPVPAAPAPKYMLTAAPMLKENR